MPCGSFYSDCFLVEKTTTHFSLVINKILISNELVISQLTDHLYNTKQLFNT